MKIFLDTAVLEEIETAKQAGILDGVTTNPSLIRKVIDDAKGDFSAETLERHLRRIFEIVGTDLPVSLEVIAEPVKGKKLSEVMVEEGKRLYEKFALEAAGKRVEKGGLLPSDDAGWSWGHGHAIIKIPINPSMDTEESAIYDGLEAIATLSRQGIPINTTLIMTPEQALLAAKAGARYVSPFAGRIDDYLYLKSFRHGPPEKREKDAYYPAEGVPYEHSSGRVEIINDNGIVSGVDLVAKIVRILANYPELETEVLAASIRNTRQAREVALAGAHIATVPFYVLRQMLEHQKTREGMETFTRDTLPQYREVIYGEKAKPKDKPPGSYSTT
ncbi:transaldolase [Candidatus Woesearchaeota archaeon]|nr:transaldolase [Candidatus Woesearchaeota archaeon]